MLRGALGCSRVLKGAIECFEGASECCKVLRVLSSAMCLPGCGFCNRSASTHGMASLMQRLLQAREFAQCFLILAIPSSLTDTCVLRMSMQGAVFSEAGKLLAYSLASGGSDWNTIKVRLQGCCFPSGFLASGTRRLKFKRST